MKRIICVVLAMSAWMCTFAKESKNNTKDAVDCVKLLSDFFNQGNAVLPAVKNVLLENERLKGDTLTLGEEKRSLEAELTGTNQMFTTKEMSTMILMYPMTVKYDSSLVAQSLAIIEKYKMNEQKATKVLFRDMLPVLKKYKDYNEEIYNMVKNIMELYVELKEPYSMENLDRTLKKTSYDKDCASKGNEIPFLEDVISEVRVYIKENRLTVGNLQELLKSMK